MKTIIHINNKTYQTDLSKPNDISIPLRGSSKNPEAWNLDPPIIEPVKDGGWVGSVKKGASVNFNNIRFNPHAHGTHTECVGHIATEIHSVNRALDRFHFLAQVISVTPAKRGKDEIISLSEVKKQLKGNIPEALIIRTLPNTAAKKSRKYSHTNWPYLDARAANYLREQGVMHLLIDLPSIDKEKDDGKLAAHRAFWNYPAAPRHHATITEFIFVPNRIKDGPYLLNLHMASFENDASPSRPVLFRLKPI
ncbi:MAG: cyclase family protein [Bacteroidia bacterium]|nr:cyclase family protein [Bacteroidia bacterium]